MAYVRTHRLRVHENILVRTYVRVRICTGLLCTAGAVLSLTPPPPPSSLRPRADSVFNQSVKDDVIYDWMNCDTL